jgi:hypothetical protein
VVTWIPVAETKVELSRGIKSFTGIRFIEAEGGNVGHPQSIWKHKKYGKRSYSGHYRRVEGEREFILVATLRTGKYHVVTFESHEMAEQVGWHLTNPRDRKKNKIVRRKK